MRYVLVHGFNVRTGGRKSIDRLAPGLRARGHEVDTDGADYGFVSLFRVRYAWKSTDLQERLAGAFFNANVIVAHSNGANYTVKTLNRMRKAHPDKILIFMAPALNRDTPMPRWTRRLYCLHSRRDWLVRLSSYLLFHPWGRAGALGMTDDNPGIINMDQYHRIGFDHSGYFRDANLRYYVDVCDRLSYAASDVRIPI